MSAWATDWKRAIVDSLLGVKREILNSLTGVKKSNRELPPRSDLEQVFLMLTDSLLTRYMGCKEWLGRHTGHA
jgi:hypothetical protein